MRTIDADVLKAAFETDGYLSPYMQRMIDACPTVEFVTERFTIDDLKRAAYEIRKICDKCSTCKECPFNGEGAGCRFKAPFPRNWMIGTWKEKYDAIDLR